MYQNFEGLERGEDIKFFNFLGVFPIPFGVLNQKNLFPTSIYQFEHFGTHYCGVWYFQDQREVWLLPIWAISLRPISTWKHNAWKVRAAKCNELLMSPEIKVLLLKSCNGHVFWKIHYEKKSTNLYVLVSISWNLRFPVSGVIYSYEAI